MNKSFLQPQNAGITFLKVILCLGFLNFLPKSGSARQPDTTSATVNINGTLPGQIAAGPVSFYIDSTGSFGIGRQHKQPSEVPYPVFQSLFHKSPAHYGFWLRFELTNRSDSSLLLYLYCGNINLTDLYVISDSFPLQHIKGGNLFRFPPDSSFLQQLTETSRFYLHPFQKAEVYLRLDQKTEDYDFEGIYLYSEKGLYQTIGEDSLTDHPFFSFQLLFQGILICQLLYVLFQWIIIKRKEYAYYFFYLLFIGLYFLSRFEVSFQTRLIFARIPVLRVYLNKTLLMMPYFFYFRFIRSFLDMPQNYPVMNKWIVRIEYFLLAYMVFDLAFVVTTFNVKLQRELYTYLLTIVFIASASFIIYLFSEKKALIYFILSGSLFVGLGNIIGLILTYLEDENITHSPVDKLMFSQIGIILEIVCFTAGLSYKSMSAEKEKIKSQEKLIEQLKANEILQSKMQNIRNRIAQDLHDDIGSTLSSISILSNLALRGQNANQTLAAMEEINDSSITLMEKMDDIVWSINPRNDSLEKLLIRIKRFATALFEAKNIEYSIIIPENIREVIISMEWRQHIYLILKEAINNLVKYAGASQAEILVKHQNDSLELTIRDNGKGFDTSASMNGNGVISMKSRADAMQAGLVVQSSPGIGSTIVLTLKIK